MINFCVGFLFGIVLKDKFVDLVFNGLKQFYKKNENEGIQKISFVCKIENTLLFNELFPDHPNKSVNKVQPYWDYFPNKQIIKIKLDDELCNLDFNSINIKELIQHTTLDLEFFEQLGQVYIYIHYNNKYINVYYEDFDIISSDDFIVKQPKLDFICATLKNNTTTEYVSKELNMYTNSNVPITPEIVILNIDTLDINTDFIKLTLVHKNNIQEYLSKEII